jgi:uncharacterized protein (TIGR01777 family)
MRIIITGGTGVIGRELAASLREDQHEVIVLSRYPEQARGLPEGVRAVWWDGRTAKAWGYLVDGADAIVNLAGESIGGSGLIPARWTPERKQRILQSRLNAANAVVEAVNAATRKPGVVIQASAVGYYGASGDSVITEASAPGNDFLAQVCVQWEQATAALETMGVRRAVIRTGLVLSAGGGVLPRLMLPFRFFVGGALGTGRQWYPWIHIDDLTHAIRFLITRADASGSFNLTAPNPVTNGDFSRALGHAMHRPSLFPVPSFALRLALGEMATLVLDGQRAVPRRLEDLGFVFRFREAEAALRDLLDSTAARPHSAPLAASQAKGQQS